MLNSSHIHSMLLVRFTAVIWSTASESTFLGLPDRQGSCNPNKISSTLLYYDQLLLRFFHNKCFWFLPRSYDRVRTHKAQVSEFEYYAAFKSHEDCSNTKRVNALTYVILPVSAVAGSIT